MISLAGSLGQEAFPVAASWVGNTKDPLVFFLQKFCITFGDQSYMLGYPCLEILDPQSRLESPDLPSDQASPGGIDGSSPPPSMGGASGPSAGFLHMGGSSTSPQNLVARLFLSRHVIFSPDFSRCNTICKSVAAF